jgi:mannose-6-phosphate isomerase-like protein (cupin superfamily)
MSPGVDVANFRRVVVGLNAEGKSTVIADGPSPHVKTVSPTKEYTELWVTPSTPPDGDGGLVDAAESAPNALVPEDPRGTLCRVSRTDPDPPDVDHTKGMHASETVDYCFVLSGEIVCMFDDGEVTLGPGDCLIQRGTRHVWSNRTDEAAVIACVMVGAPDHVTADSGWTLPA